MPIESPLIRHARRLKTVDAAHRVTMKSLHNDYNKAYDAAMRVTGTSVTTLLDHFNHPPEFYEVTEEARKAFLAGHELAMQARHSSASRLPRKG